VADERRRELILRLARTSDPVVADQVLAGEVRAGRWLTSRADGGDWDDNTHRLGTLRFLGYLGWPPAIDLLTSLPLEETGSYKAAIPVRDRVPPTAYSEIGPDVAKAIAPTVLAAAAASACMAVVHLLPSGTNVAEALDLYAETIRAWRAFREEACIQDVPGRGHRSEPCVLLYEEAQRARNRLSGLDTKFRPRGQSNNEPDVRSPKANAVYSALTAWTEFLGAPCRHESDQAGEYASAIFWATHALAWECEPDVPASDHPQWRSPAWEALGEYHWLRAHRLKRGWSDRHGARLSSRCMRVAKKKMREAMRDTALVAAASLVS